MLSMVQTMPTWFPSPRDALLLKHWIFTSEMLPKILTIPKAGIDVFCSALQRRVGYPKDNYPYYTGIKVVILSYDWWDSDFVRKFVNTSNMFMINWKVLFLHYSAQRVHYGSTVGTFRHSECPGLDSCCLLRFPLPSPLEWVTARVSVSATHRWCLCSKERIFFLCKSGLHGNEINDIWPILSRLMFKALYKN